MSLFFEQLNNKINIAKNEEEVKRIARENKELENSHTFCIDYVNFIDRKMNEMLEKPSDKIHGDLKEESFVTQKIGFGDMKSHYKRDPLKCSNMIRDFLINKYGAKNVTMKHIIDKKDDKFNQIKQFCNFSSGGVCDSSPFYAILLDVPNKNVEIHYGETYSYEREKNF